MSPSTGLCEGCFRTLDEIAGWSHMDDRDKRAVWLLLDERRPNNPDAIGESSGA